MVVRFAGEKFKRETGFRAGSMPRFVRRSEGDDRIKPLTLERLAVELGFAARRWEVAFREGKKGVAVSGLEVFVVEKSSGGEHDVGVVGSVGEELLVDHGEKVGAL